MEIAALSPQLAREMVDAFRALQRSGVLANIGGSRESFSPSQYHYVVNGSADIVPPFACMQAVGTQEIGGQNYIGITRPVDKYGQAGPYLFNGPNEIGVGELGIGYAGPLVRMRVNAVSGTSGTRYEPAVGQWFLSGATNGPFIMIGPDDIGESAMKGVMTYLYDNLPCDDARKPITDIRWESPKLQYRKGDLCDWKDILTGSSCSAPTSPPGSVASTGTTTTSVSLSWSDNSTNEDGFQVEYKASSSGTWLVFTTTAANATTATVTGLTAGTSYDFRVAATNVYGMSSYSTVTGISTSASP